MSVYISVRVIKASLRFCPKASQQVHSAAVWQGRIVSSTTLKFHAEILIFSQFISRRVVMKCFKSKSI